MHTVVLAATIGGVYHDGGTTAVPRLDVHGAEARVDQHRLRAFSRGAVLVTTAIVLGATLAPSDWIGVRPSIPDVAWHGVVFAGFGASLALVYATSDAARRSPRRLLVMALLAIWLFAASTELLQERIPGREPELADWVADVAGGALGFLLIGPLCRAVVRRGEP